MFTCFKALEKYNERKSLMSLFGKIATTIVKENKPVNRLFTDAFESMGAITRKPDSRTTGEIQQTVDYIQEQQEKFNKQLIIMHKGILKLNNLQKILKI